MLNKTQRQFFAEIQRSHEITQRRLERMGKNIQSILGKIDMIQNRLDVLNPIRRQISDMQLFFELTEMVRHSK